MSARKFFKYYSVIPRLQAEELLNLISAIGSAISGSENNSFIDRLLELANVKIKKEEEVDISLLGSLGIVYEKKEG